MAIYKTRSGRYKVVLDVGGGMHSPRERQSYGTFRTKKEAERKESQVLERKAQGYSVRQSRLTIGELIERYIVSAEARLRSPATISTYRSLKRRYFGEIGALPAAALTPSRLQSLYDELTSTLAGKTVRDAHGFLNAVLAESVRLELIERNVAANVRAPVATRSTVTSLAPEALAALLLEAKESRYGPIATLAVASGMRRGELAALKWDCVDLEKRELQVAWTVVYVGEGKRVTMRKDPKGRRRRVVPLNELAMAALKRQHAIQAAERLAVGEAYEASGYVFTDALGRPHSPDMIYRCYRKVTKAAQVANTKLHSARHTAASLMLAAGIDPTTVAEIIGHEQVSTTTDIYGHAIEGRKRSAVDAIDAAVK